MDGKEVVLMSPEGAQKIYMRGCDAVVKTICDLSKKNEKLQGENLKLKEKISTLSKNSSNSGKSPSSDDITKHRKKTRVVRSVDTPDIQNMNDVHIRKKKLI